jgi:hypothetical protein
LSSYSSHASSSQTSVFVFDVLHIFYFITYIQNAEPSLIWLWIKLHCCLKNQFMWTISYNLTCISFFSKCFSEVLWNALWLT